jgi:hypothetical protein
MTNIRFMPLGHVTVAESLNRRVAALAGPRAPRQIPAAAEIP